ncbi:hypothetical protein CALCODRAFT_521085 [Calocera cornea HHB12733]|uniref:Mid2 domain-containing protein n=1 Tax=Calocera cornea HHB12733 TaxID=1353952 RepID=A0A165D1E4_9BASI|nr:hypothetical protein CALCODRAFT_521085 [Calocera cornea HHB12733]
MSQPLVNTTFPSQTNGITYSPSDAWDPLNSPGATGGSAMFDLTDELHGYSDAFITWTFPQPATGFEYWAYQRSDGGLFSICFDCSPTSTLGDRIDALNASTNGTESPRLLYAKYDLPYAVHNLTIANLFDSRATILGSTSGGYGQITLDRFVLEAPLDPPPTTTTSTTSQTSSTAGTTPSDSTSPSSGSGSGSDGGLGANPPASSSSNHTGAIVGGVVGGVAAILLAILCVLLYRMLQRRRQPATPEIHRLSMKSDAGFAAQPFILDGGHPPTHPARQPYYPTMVPTSVSSPSVGSESVQGLVSSPYTPVWSEAPAVQPTAATSPASPVTTQAMPSIYGAMSEPSVTSGYPSGVPRMDADAGFLQGDELDEAASTLPPDYDMATALRHLEGRRT